MGFAAKEWVLSLVKKIYQKGYFFDVGRLRCTSKTIETYNVTNVPLTAKSYLIGEVPFESAGGQFNLNIYREAITFSGTGYPTASILLNDMVMVDHFELIPDQTVKFTINASKGDKIYLIYHETRDAASVTRYTIKSTYKGDYLSYI